MRRVELGALSRERRVARGIRVRAQRGHRLGMLRVRALAIRAVRAIRLGDREPVLVGARRELAANLDERERVRPRSAVEARLELRDRAAVVLDAPRIGGSSRIAAACSSRRRASVAASVARALASVASPAAS
jgi:hypothetical protein